MAVEDIIIRMMAEDDGASQLFINMMNNIKALEKTLVGTTKYFNMWGREIAGSVMESQSSLANFSKSFEAEQKRIEGIMKDTARPLSNALMSSDAVKTPILDDYYNNLEKNQKAVWANYYKNVDGAQRITKSFRNQVENTDVKFAGWAMSIMFFGMALQKTFDTIWKSSTKTFNDIMHSVDGTTTGFDMLEGSMKFLQFSVGEALEPLAAALVPVIDFVTDLVQKNPELTREIIKWGIILGTLFMVGGAGKLAYDGFASFGIAIGDSSNAIDTFGGKVANVATIIGRMVGTAIVIDASIKLITKEQDFTDLIDNFLIGAGLLVGITNPLGLAGITIGVALMLLPDDFKFQLMTALASFVGIIMTAVSAIFETALLPMTLMVNSLIGAYNYITGNSVPTIQTYALTRASANRTMDLFGAGMGFEQSQSNLLNPGDRYTIQLFVDGNEISNTISSNIINNTG